MPIRNSKHRRLWLAVTIVAGVFVFYIVTAGLAEAISGNIQVGRLPWLRSDGALDALDAYGLPARCSVRVPGVAWFFQSSENFWRRVTGAPICVYYGTRLEQVLVSDAPKDLMETFRRECPHAQVVSVAKKFGGRTGKQFIFWVIRFKQDGKLREALMDTPRKADMTFDVNDP